MNQLLERARLGDREAEQELFLTLRARFMLIAKRRVRENEEAEDVVQQACVTVFEKYKTEDFKAGFEPWIYTVLRMKIGNYLQLKSTRQKRFRPDSIDRPPSEAVTPVPKREIEMTLVDCLNKILAARPNYARVLSLTYQGYKADEICALMTVTRSNLYSLLSRSRTLLGHCMETGKV